MSNEEELNKLAYEAQYLTQQAQDMQRQLQQAVIVINNIDATIKTIDGLSGVKEETYFQIGSNAHVLARPSENRKVLIEIGAKVMVEKEPAEAKELLRNHKVQMEKAVELLKKSNEQVSKRLMEIDMKAEELQTQ